MRQVEKRKALYLLTVKEVSNLQEKYLKIIANGAATGFGECEEEKWKFNNGLGDTIERTISIKLIKIENFNFSDDGAGFVW